MSPGARLDPTLDRAAVRRLLCEWMDRACYERDRYREALEAIWDNPMAARAIVEDALADPEDDD